MVNQRRLGNEVELSILPPYQAVDCVIVAATIHSIDAGTQEEFRGEGEGGVQSSSHKAFGRKIGHKDHVGMGNGLVSRQGHERRSFGGELGVVGVDRIQVDTQHKPGSRGHVEDLLILKATTIPIAMHAGLETTSVAIAQTVTSIQIDEREVEV